MYISTSLSGHRIWRACKCFEFKFQSIDSRFPGNEVWWKIMNVRRYKCSWCALNLRRFSINKVIVLKYEGSVESFVSGYKYTKYEYKK